MDSTALLELWHKLRLAWESCRCFQGCIDQLSPDEGYFEKNDRGRWIKSRTSPQTIQESVLMLDTARAEARLLWILLDHTTKRFAKRLGVNTFSVGGVSYASATHALVLWLDDLIERGSPISPEMTLEFGRTVIAAQAECLELELEDESRLQWEAAGLGGSRTGRPQGDSEDNRAGHCELASEKHLGLAAPVEPVVKEDVEQPPAKADDLEAVSASSPPVSKGTASQAGNPSLMRPVGEFDATQWRLYFLLHHRQCNVSEAAEVLGVDRGNLGGWVETWMATGQIADGDQRDWLRLTAAGLECLKDVHEVGVKLPWVDRAVAGVESRRERLRHQAEPRL